MPKAKTMEMNKAFCPVCSGEGDVKGTICKKCQGTGWLHVDQLRHTDLVDDESSMHVFDEDDGEY